MVVVWFAAVVGGMGVLIGHQSTPGEAAKAPQRWPESSGLRREPGVATLVMLAHPLCPCTRASLAELARLMPHVAGRVDVHVLFLRPEAADESWGESDLRGLAAAIPGVKVHEDLRGDAAAAFGSLTSGQTLLYDAAGNLQFAGGITAARGHEGDNLGRDTITALVLGEETRVATAPVFGCALRRPEELRLAGAQP